MIDFNVNSSLSRTLYITLGAVMLLAILDHTRIFFHYWNTSPTDLDTTTVSLFFTRAISHLFAPAAFFISGVQCYVDRKGISNQAFSLILLKKGFVLILLELVVNNFLYTFDPFYRTIGLFILAMLGIALIFLAALIYLPSKVLITLAMIALFGHQFLDQLHFEGNSYLDIMGYILHQQKFLEGQDILFIINYTVFPWTALLWLGYAIGPWFAIDYSPHKRAKALKVLATGCLFLFVWLRVTGWYGEPSSWILDINSPQITLMSFFNLTKYPASVCLILLTIGTLFLFMGYMEGKKFKISPILEMYGRSALFIYLLSTLVLHLSAMLILPLEGIAMVNMVIIPSSFLPESKLANHGFSLLTVYWIWFIFIVAFIPVLRVYLHLRRKH